jgi:phage/plasmid-associated DNA primase
VTKDKEKADLSKGLGKTLQQTLLAFERECDLKTLEDDEDDLDDHFEPPPPTRKSKRSKKKKEDDGEDDVEESAMSKEEHHKLKSIELRKKLSSKRYIYSIVNLLSILSWKDTFEDELDSKPNMIAFKNGIINLHKRDEQGNFILEKGHPDHMLSMCLDANYVEFEETDPKVIFVRNFFAQIFPNPKVAEYVMGCLALCFYGQNTEKIVCFFTGSGNNAKSLLNKLMASLLKSLCTEVNINVFNQRKEAENATPQLAKVAKKRLVQVAEATATITTNLLKQMTGDDKVPARKLRNDDNSFDPMCQIHFSSNALPHLVDFCDAMKERVRVIEFPSKFVTKEAFDSYTPEERAEKHIFLQDPFIRSKIDMDAFAFVLMKTFKEQFGNRIVPDEVRLSTADFSSENNMYENFISRHISKAGAEHRIHLDEAFNEFKKFARANSSTMTLNKQSFKAQMNILLKTSVECSPLNKREQWWPRHNLSTV